MSKYMQVKVFTAFGEAGIEKIEEEVNEWLHENEDIEAIKTETCMCSVGSTSELYQCIVITVWWR